jgi:hypothetical protein
MLVSTNLSSQFSYEDFSLDYSQTGGAAVKKFIKMVRTFSSRK